MSSEVLINKRSLLEVVRSDKSESEFNRQSSAHERLIVVANRLPMTIIPPNDSCSEYTFTVSNGGLVSGLRGIQGMNFIWIGWPGTTIPESDWDFVISECRKCNCHPVFLDQTTIDLFYNIFCNNVLWPLIHYVPPPMESSSDTHTEQWKAYCYANARFVDAILDVYSPNDFVWVHDYHLMLVPKLLRRRISDARIGQEVFRMLPYRKELLTGLLSANLVGFHVYDYLRHFLSSCMQLLGLETTAQGIDGSPVGGVFAYCSAIPIGIETDQFTKMLKDSSVLEAIKRLKTQFGHRKVILGVDRLDYMKGLPHKLNAFDHFLELYPSWNDRCVLVQLAIPTRTVVPEYQRLKSTVHEIVGMINGKRGKLTHVPVHYLDQTLTFNELVALYRVADVAIITSIRDGMNLVAYEYIACQAKKYGVLILSEFAGAAQSLGAGSIRINPWNIEETANAIYRSLTMSRAERRARHDYAMNHVTTHTSKKWAEVFIDTLREVSDYNAQVRASVSPLLNWRYLHDAFKNSRRKIIIIDFPEAIASSKGSKGIPMKRFKRFNNNVPDSVIDALKKLSEVPDTTVMITTPHLSYTVDHLFENSQVCIAAEKGCVYKNKHNEWIRFVEEKSPSHTTLTGNSGSSAGFQEERTSSSGISVGANILSSFTQSSTSKLGTSPTAKRNSEQFRPTIVSNDWSVGVEKIFEFFQQRTPGSHTEKTTGSVTWYWDEALPDFGKQQSRDLLVHLWAGPLANVSSADTEVVVGHRFVEVRSTQCGRAKLMANILQYEFNQETEPLSSKDLVICIGNFPRRDENIHNLFEEPKRYFFKEQSYYESLSSNHVAESFKNETVHSSSKMSRVVSSDGNAEEDENEDLLDSGPQYISISVGTNVISKTKFCLPSPYQVQYLLYSLVDPNKFDLHMCQSLKENDSQTYYQSIDRTTSFKKHEESDTTKIMNSKFQQDVCRFTRNDILGEFKFDFTENTSNFDVTNELSYGNENLIEKPQSQFPIFLSSVEPALETSVTSGQPPSQIVKGVPIPNYFSVDDLLRKNIEENVLSECRENYFRPFWKVSMNNKNQSCLFDTTPKSQLFRKHPVLDLNDFRGTDTTENTGTKRESDVLKVPPRRVGRASDKTIHAQQKQHFSDNSWPPEIFSFAGSVAGDLPYMPPSNKFAMVPNKIPNKETNNNISDFGTGSNYPQKHIVKIPKPPRHHPEYPQIQVQSILKSNLSHQVPVKTTSSSPNYGSSNSFSCPYHECLSTVPNKSSSYQKSPPVIVQVFPSASSSVNSLSNNHHPKIDESFRTFFKINPLSQTLSTYSNSTKDINSTTIPITTSLNQNIILRKVLRTSFSQPSCIHLMSETHKVAGSSNQRHLPIIPKTITKSPSI